MKCLLLSLAIGITSVDAVSADPFPRDAATGPGQRDLAVVTSFFEGSFDPVKEAVESPVLVLRHVRLWPERTGEHWFLVQYLARGEVAKPLWQRIYRLGESGGEVLAVVYDLPPAPAQAPFQAVKPETLVERPGCRIRFERQQLTIFAGGTVGRKCRSGEPQVAYEMTDYFLTSSSLRTWTQGFDPAGTPVWQLSGAPLETRRTAAPGKAP